MLFSVITVVYNGADILEKTIDSVISQDFKEFEYVIIDGGSDDGTIELIRKYNENIDKFISEPDEGIYDAMNKGVKLSTGKFIIFMNAGDVFYNKHVLKKVSRLEIDNYEVLYGDTVSINLGASLETRVVVKDLKFLWKSLGYCGLCHQSVFISRKLLLKHPFSLLLNVVADFEQILLIYYNGHGFLYLGTFVSKIIQNGISSQSFVESKIESFGVVKRNLDKLVISKTKVIIFYSYYITIKYIKALIKKSLSKNAYFFCKQTYEKLCHKVKKMDIVDK